MSTKTNSPGEFPVIAFYCSSIAWGGLEMNTVRYAQWMKERGWPVLLICVAGSKIDLHARNSDLTILHVKRNRKYFDYANAWYLARVCKAMDIKLCWFRDTRDFALLGWAKRFSGGQFKLLYQQAMQFGVSKRDPAHTWRFKAVDAWVSTLNFLAEQVKKQTRFPHHKIHVVPLGVDVSQLKVQSDTPASARSFYQLPLDAFVLGIIGRLDPLKGQHIAIKALASVHQQGFKAHLLIVGESTLHEGQQYELQLKQLVREQGLEDFVHFAPYTKEVARFYQAIDLFLMCSKGETFGTVTIEAMAMNKPVIGTDSSGTPEILSHGAGWLVPPDDEIALAQQIIALIQEPSKMNEGALRGHQRFEQLYSKEASLLQMESIVLNLLQ